MQWPKKKNKKERVESDFGYLHFPFRPVEPSGDGDGGGGAEENEEMEVLDEEADDDEVMGGIDDGYRADNEGKGGG